MTQSLAVSCLDWRLILESIPRLVGTVESEEPQLIQIRFHLASCDLCYERWGRWLQSDEELSFCEWLSELGLAFCKTGRISKQSLLCASPGATPERLEQALLSLEMSRAQQVVAHAPACRMCSSWAAPLARGLRSRGRAENLVALGQLKLPTADGRKVADLVDKLSAWALPLVGGGGVSLDRAPAQQVFATEVSDLPVSWSLEDALRRGRDTSPRCFQLSPPPLCSAAVTSTADTVTIIPEALPMGRWIAFCLAWEEDEDALLETSPVGDRPRRVFLVRRKGQGRSAVTRSTSASWSQLRDVRRRGEDRTAKTPSDLTPLDLVEAGRVVEAWQATRSDPTASPFERSRCELLVLAKMRQLIHEALLSEEVFLREWSSFKSDLFGASATLEAQMFRPKDGLFQCLG